MTTLEAFKGVMAALGFEQEHNSNGPDALVHVESGRRLQVHWSVVAPDEVIAREDGSGMEDLLMTFIEAMWFTATKGAPKNGIQETADTYLVHQPPRESRK